MAVNTRECAAQGNHARGFVSLVTVGQPSAVGWTRSRPTRSRHIPGHRAFNYPETHATTAPHHPAECPDTRSARAPPPARTDTHAHAHATRNHRDRPRADASATAPAHPEPGTTRTSNHRHHADETTRPSSLPNSRNWRLNRRRSRTAFRSTKPKTSNTKDTRTTATASRITASNTMHTNATTSAI